MKDRIDLQQTTIAVTGATGFLGRYIVESLRARGARVIGVVRNPDRVPDLACPGVELRRADLADREALARGFAGATAVVSNAALYSLRNQRWADHEASNVQGTRNVLAALVEAGVSRVVHISSVAVYLGGTRQPIGEESPQFRSDSRRRPTNVYSVSKALSEQLAWQTAREHGLHLTVVRPCQIYGAFDPNFTFTFRRLIGLPLGVIPAFMHYPLVYAGDVAEAVARILERAASIGRAYNLGGDDRTVWQFARAWKEAGGRAGPVTLPLPLPVRRSYNSRQAERDLGWQNRPFVAGLRETLELEARATGHERRSPDA